MDRTDKDMYGTPQQEAEQTLSTFLHETLHEPQAELDGLELVDGRWQSHVNNSERGIRVVFLEQHGGEIVPGHMTVDAHPEAIKKNW